MNERIPVILHTDIGGDIDDTWALAMMLKQPFLNPLMILTDTDNTVYRAAICEKMIAGTEFENTLEIGAGTVSFPERHIETHLDWVKDYDMTSYKGKFHYNGIERMIKIIMDSKETVTLVSIGPCPALAAALEIEHGIARKCNFVGMFGSIAFNHDGNPGAIAEYNVLCNVKAFQKVIKAPWKKITLTPLDTCGRIRLEGELYREIALSTDPMLKNVIENYRLWRKTNGLPDACEGSSILYDTVAIHLASSTEFIEMKQMNISVTDDGFTVEDNQNGREVEVALAWKDIEGYKRFLSDTLKGAI